jgi:uncharacterized protein (DUF433 family)
MEKTADRLMDRSTAMAAREVFPGVTVDANVVHGRPVITGTRVPVEVVTGALAGGSTFDEVQEDYHLTLEQLKSALAYATQVLKSKAVYAAS